MDPGLSLWGEAVISHVSHCSCMDIRHSLRQVYDLEAPGTYYDQFITQEVYVESLGGYEEVLWRGLYQSNAFYIER